MPVICDAHIHVGRYYRMTDAATFDRSDFYYEPKVVADVLKRCGVEEFIFSPMALQDVVPIEDVIREARETQAAFGPGAHPFYWVTGPFYDADPDFKILDDGLFEGVKIHELETPWVKERPKDLNALLLRAAAQAGTKHYYAAQRTLERAMRAHPKSYLPYYNLANLLIQQGEDLETAKEYYELGRTVGGPVNKVLEARLKGVGK